MKFEREIRDVMDASIQKEFMRVTDETHSFSKNYERQKQKILETAQEADAAKKINRMKPIRRVMATSAGMVVLCTVGTFAATQAIQRYSVYTKNSGKYKVDVMVESEEFEEESEDAAKQEYVRLNISYLPVGLEEMQGSDGMKYYFKNDLYMNGIVFQLYDVSQIKDKMVLENFNVVSTNVFELNGHKAIYLKGDEEIANILGTDKYNKKMYIYFEEENYIVMYMACALISDSDMHDIGKGISLEKTDKQHATYLSRWQNEKQAQDSDNLVCKLPEEEINIYSRSEEFSDKVFLLREETTKELVYNVKDIEVSDKLDMTGGGVTDEKYQEFLDENGNLIPNTLVYVKDGDGINSLANIVAKETVPLKIVNMTVSIKNNSGMDYENFTPNFALVKMKKEGGDYRLVQYTKDIECDRVLSSAEVIQNSMIYSDFVNEFNNISSYVDVLKAGEERTFHIAFCVNECDLPYLYLNTNKNANSVYFFDKADEKNKDRSFNYVKIQE